MTGRIPPGLTDEEAHPGVRLLSSIRPHVILESIDSTNAEALRLGRDLAPGEAQWVLAHEQTAGRGRRARAWVSPRGNFTASLAQRLDEPPAIMGLRSFVAALALDDAFTALTGCPQVFALKWPNDVLLNGGKLTGILLEASDGVLVTGIGVNLFAAPPASLVEAGAVPPVSILGEMGLRVTPEAFLESLAHAMATRSEQFAREGFAPIRAAWLSRAARLGEEIIARTGRDSHTGTFETIDADGNLMLRTRVGLKAIAAADVFF